MSRSILVTVALPYSNGELHLGHLMEHIQADIWVRHQRQLGNNCLHFCADDTHGAPVMIGAKKRGITPEALISEMQKKHMGDFKDFGIEFTHYSFTHSKENEELCRIFFHHMKKKQLIETMDIEQAYCEQDAMFLPDRFLLGDCPNCGAFDQYGDSCDVCSATYSPTEMKNPRCVLCGNTPVQKKSEHLFFKLNTYKNFLKEWITHHTSKEVSNKLQEWLKEDLKPWDISRDKPYFGFEIPGYKDKYFYVWVDAPVGYIATTKEWCDQNGESLEKWWKSPDVDIYHFIGKDIVYFHTLFWPAMLKASGYTLPKEIFAHGFMTVNGKKMSKSKGTFINPRTYLKHLNPEYLRYYLACKLSPGIEDLDLNWDDFLNRVNSDLIGKITNIASRGAQMLEKNFEGQLGTLSNEGRQLVEALQNEAQVISRLYLTRDYTKAMVLIRNYADKTNKYFNDREPWVMIKTDPQSTHSILTDILNMFRLLSIYLTPVMPNYVSQVWTLFGEKQFEWSDINIFLEKKKLSPFRTLLTKIEKRSLDNIIEESKAEEKTPTNNGESRTENYEEIAEQINFDAFMSVDLRVGKILEAEVIEGTDKLLRLKVDIGIEVREIISGIKLAYDPKELVGRYTVVAANLKPRKMKFGISNGMVLAAGEGGNNVYILSPDNGAKIGQRVS